MLVSCSSSPVIESVCCRFSGSKVPLFDCYRNIEEPNGNVVHFVLTLLIFIFRCAAEGIEVFNIFISVPAIHSITPPEYVQISVVVSTNTVPKAPHRQNARTTSNARIESTAAVNGTTALAPSATVHRCHAPIDITSCQNLPARMQHVVTIQASKADRRYFRLIHG